MIHSLSGGSIKGAKGYTFVKVEPTDETSATVWLKCSDIEVNVGDVVVYEDKTGWLKRGVVVRVDKNVSEQTPPAPLRLMPTVLAVENKFIV